MEQPVNGMTYLKKPMNYKNQMKLEHYLVTLQEFALNPCEELAELLDEISKEVSEFLTPEEIEKLDDLIEQPDEQQFIDISIKLPKGYKAEHYEVADGETKIDMRTGTIYFTAVISAIPPDSIFQDL